MKRRHFIQTAFILSHANMLNPALAGDTSPIQWKKDYTVPEMELVGRTRPPLFGDGFNLRKEAADAFDTMRRAAGAEGINMYSASSFRSFNRQKGIWNRKYIKYTKEGKSPQEAIRAIIEYSTLPGSSRHHWGTDLDIIDTAVPQPKDHPLIATHFHEGGAYQKLFEWLLKHANEYGFYLTYTNNPKRQGFAYEPWHWSYAPLSIPLLIQFNQLSLKKHVDAANLKGKKHLTEAFLEKYKRIWGFGIHPDLIPHQLR